ncbi:MAG: acyltransferase, partial [Treponema sp.]|nr:acyltransferase [Treponema sp.]
MKDIGVEFFFILSGFVISYKYAQKIADKTISKKEFFVARIARIYPLHCITFLFVALLVLRDTLRHDISFPWTQMLFNISLLQSFVPSRSYYFSFNAVSWSISDELFFYVMFPVLIYCLQKIRRIGRVLLCFAILVCYFVVISIIPEEYVHPLFYISPYLRIIDFMIGIGLFHLWEKLYADKTKNRFFLFLQKKGLASFVEITALGFLILMVFVSDKVPQRFRYASYYWIPMALVILCFSKTAPSGGGGGNYPPPVMEPFGVCR